MEPFSCAAKASVTAKDISFIAEQNLLELYEEILDDVFSFNKKREDILDAMAKWPANWTVGTSAAVCKKIKDKAQALIKELEQYHVDPFVKEAYSQLSPQKVNNIIEWLTGIVNTKRQYNTRKRRVSNKVTKAFKFNKEGDPNLKAMPFVTNPDKIVGSSAVLIWIPKTRFAVWIEAKDRSGLAIAKNNILRFSDSLSFAKKIRKPEEFVNIVRGQNKRGVLTYLKSVKTKEFEVDGKMSKKYMIVRVF